MRQLEKLAQKGWIFAIWVSKHGGCIIQGKKGTDPHDFDFDVQAISFSEAVKLAVAETEPP